MNKEELLSQMNEGRTAQVTLQWMRPLFENQEKQTIESVKALFRAGKHTELVLACHVARLCAIEDLKTELEGLSRRAQSAADKLNEGELDG
jgi:hypothetical protein